MSSEISPRFVLDEKGNRSEVILSLKDYQMLVEAWEESIDAKDFQKAKATASEFVSLEDLKHELS